MRKILKMRWVILAVWLIATLTMTVLQPDLKQILSEKGDVILPNDSSSKMAQDLLNGMSHSKGATALLVFHQPEGISTSDMQSISQGLQALRDNQAQLGITGIIDPFAEPAAKDQLISKDGTTLMVSVTFTKNGRDTETVRRDLESKLVNVSVQHYLTGGPFISNDFLKASKKGVDKSAVLTIGFILLVLILMFRSAVTPLVSLGAVGVAYLCSMGIVGQLIQHVGFPVTSLTQMFLILVLFGIGTDYNILLFNRFKEELARNQSIDDAIVTTYKTAGKTILFSGLTVFIAFASLSFVQFGVYRSGNAVAIGIVVLLLELMTLTPLLMKMLANKLFWPAHNVQGHRESTFWGKVTSVSVKHPIWVLVVVLALLAPVLYFQQEKLSFDNMKDMGANYPSVQGFRLVTDHFGKGNAMPTTVVLHSTQSLDTNEMLALLDGLTEKLKQVKGVKKVSGPTQPLGAPLDMFYTSGQTQQVVDGLAKTNDGVIKISGGLQQIKDKLVAPDFSSVKDLVRGTGDIHTGLQRITQALQQIQVGLDGGAKGVQTIGQGIKNVRTNLAMISDSSAQLATGLAQLQGAYVTFGDNYKNIAQQLGGIFEGLSGMKLLIDNLAELHPELAKDSAYLTLKATTAQLVSGLGQLTAGLQALNIHYADTTASFAKATEGLKALNAGQAQIVNGLQQLEGGTTALQEGLKKGSAGQGTIVTNLGKLVDGIGQIKDGQQKLSDGLLSLSGGMNQLKDGIGASSDGLHSISAGLDKTGSFLEQLTQARTFFAPTEALTNADFTRALDAFMSKDRKTVKLVVNLDADPYSTEATKTVHEINNAVSTYLKGTNLAHAAFGTAGESSATNDVKAISTHDITTTQIIVLISVFIILVVVIRSFWIPVYITASLMAAYYTAMSLTGYLTAHWLKADGIAWNVPFFSFIMIVALGVDYSIFLMMRYKEYPTLSSSEAIIKAAKNVGGVVMSAAIILAGTFATLFPSGLHTLMEMAISVSSGLMLLSLVLLPVVIPALIALPGKVARRNASPAAVKVEES